MPLVSWLHPGLGRGLGLYILSTPTTVALVSGGYIPVPVRGYPAATAPLKRSRPRASMRRLAARAQRAPPAGAGLAGAALPVLCGQRANPARRPGPDVDSPPRPPAGGSRGRTSPAGQGARAKTARRPWLAPPSQPHHRELQGPRAKTARRPGPGRFDPPPSPLGGVPVPAPPSHRSRALRGPALRTAGSASFARRCARWPSPVARSLVAERVGVAFCPLRAGRLRGSGFASCAATHPPSSTPLPLLGRKASRSLLSLDASPPSLRVGRLRWPAPCGPGVLRKRRRRPCPRLRLPARPPALHPRGLPGRAWLPGGIEGPSGRAQTPRAATWVRPGRGGKLRSCLATAQTACGGQTLKGCIPPLAPLRGGLCGSTHIHRPPG